VPHRKIQRLAREIENKLNGFRVRAETENKAMRSVQNLWLSGSVLVVTCALAAFGCHNTPVDTSDYARGPTPLQSPSPAKEAEACQTYEDSLTGGQIFSMYCSYCHNAPSLAERPFSQFQNVAAHMRVRANLTGKEYAKLMEFLRRWNDVPPPTAPVEPTPKRFYFSQPIQELRDQTEGSNVQPGKAHAGDPTSPDAVSGEPNSGAAG